MKKRILIVDDEPRILKLLSATLQHQGYETSTAGDGYQCIKLAKLVKPDLILLDIKMPLGGGLKAYKNLKASVLTSVIPTIFITAYPGEEVKRKAFDMGADGFLEKPFSKVDLFKTIDKLIGK